MTNDKNKIREFYEKYPNGPKLHLWMGKKIAEGADGFLYEMDELFEYTEANGVEIVAGPHNIFDEYRIDLQYLIEYVPHSKECLQVRNFKLKFPRDYPINKRSINMVFKKQIENILWEIIDEFTIIWNDIKMNRYKRDVDVYNWFTETFFDYVITNNSYEKACEIIDSDFERWSVNDKHDWLEGIEYDIKE